MPKTRGGMSLKLAGDWEEWRSWTLSFQGKLRIASRLAVRRAVLSAHRRIINRIKTGRYKKLTPLTAFLRQVEGYSDTPLMKTGALVRAITTDVVNDYLGQVGVLRQAKSSNGEDFSNVALLLHDGGRIKITEAMRRAFMRRLGYLAKKHGFTLLKGSRGSKKNVLRIAPRRYIEEVFEDQAFIKAAELIFDKAIRKTLGF